MIAFLDDGEGLLGAVDVLACGREPDAGRVASRVRACALLAGYAPLTAVGVLVFAAHLPVPASESRAEPVSASGAGRHHPTPPSPGAAAHAAKVRRDLPQPDRLTTPQTGRRGVHDRSR